MSISEVTGARATQGGAATTTHTYTPTTTPVAGNLMVVTFSYRLSGTSVNAVPSGWSLAGARSGNGNIWCEIYYKVATGSEPASYAWNTNASVKSAGTYMEFNSTNGWPATPLDVSTGNSGATGTTGLSTGTTGTSSGTAEHLAVAAHACDTNATWSNHSGAGATMTEISEVSSTGGAGNTRNTTSTSTGIRASGTSTFSCTADLSASNNWGARIAIFKENAGSSNTNVAVPKGDISFIEYAPIITNQYNVAVPVRAVSFINYTPQATQQFNILIPVRAVSFINYTPQATQQFNIPVPAGLLVLIEYAPTITAGTQGLQIISINPTALYEGLTGVVITGTSFGSSQGNSKVLLDGVEQTVQSWSDSSITFDVVKPPLWASSRSLRVEKEI